MFDFSFAEIALIVVVAVLFIGPDELPVVIRAVAKAMRGMRGLMKEMRGIFEDISRESGLHDETHGVVKDIKMIRGDDGLMYEAYEMPTPPGEVGGGRDLAPEPTSPHPGPPPNGEGDLHD